MLEIIFTNGKIGAKAVKIIGITEKGRVNNSAFYKDELALIKKAITQANFTGKSGKFLEVFGSSGKIILAGLGNKTSAIDLQNLGGELAKRLFKDEVACYVVEEIKGSKLSTVEIAHNIAFGLTLGSYRFDKYFTKKKQEDYPALEQVIFKVKNPEAVNEGFKEFAALGNAVRYARDLGNEPANHLNPEVFADDIKRLEYLDLEVEILDKKALEAEDFNLLLSVAQGSVNEPKVAVIKWRGNPDNNDYAYGLVGKGVTFDSGGITNIHTPNMEEMKNDMLGAAVVVASLKALALQKSPLNVVGVVGLVENMPSGSASRPGDVITSMSGQTVELIEMHAEGRLVLADCLWYLQEKFAVNKLIDVATLTGATAHALGGEYAGLFGNNEVLAKQLLKAGDDSDEKLWRLPINAAYDKTIDSPIADMKNIGGPMAGGSTAACFLQRFVKKGNAWAHLDIAGVDFEKNGTATCPKGATAFGVRLLNKLLHQ